ncbi:uncharacterized protein LAESUDRAFT_751444 [Laetiporus sulphureus 93-53]|uniref:Uncharacterized protein n=1 Tax=Laetiporus sulphureus 93-53 TaxID=1314785 RepID=A0A165CZF6_9APHY|nr:uncharacterized protein LAESUDRAFT_751444 [Laetiporus sulphureus 93-53]KZT03811.1 hypothetical protein LAESUDRAFT_751444 [Laetiporus sulphureus 93-53]
MATTVRTFAAYEDSFSSPARSLVNDMSTIVAVSIVPSKGPLLVFSPDKENINPATGLRASAERQSCKKRKTCALSTKPQAAPPAKKQKESMDGKSRSALVSVEVPKKNAKKKRAAGKRGTTHNRSSRTRRTPRVEKDAEVEAALLRRENMSQVMIDARCWELTVLPLADLSEAYAQAPSLLDELSPARENDEVVVVPPELRRIEKTKDSLAETIANERVHSRESTPEPTHAASPAANAPSTPPSSPCVSSVPATVPTPEPQAVFPAFTFSLPSPSGERYALFHASSVEPFSDPDL